MRDLKDRTRRFALDVFRFCASLPRQQPFLIIAHQLMRSGSSVGANYRAARRAPSRRAFVAKLAIVEEEADESLYWLELLEDLGLAEDEPLRYLKQEASELLPITVASKKRMRQMKAPPRS